MEPQAQASSLAGTPSSPLAAFGPSCFSPPWAISLLIGKAKPSPELQAVCKPHQTPAGLIHVGWSCL